MTDENKEELRPTKMRGVVFPKAKYGVIAALSSLWWLILSTIKKPYYL
jgi:hypothetical protein